MLSYWEKTSLTRYDYILVGGGLVGLSTALELRKEKPDARILVLDRGLFPTGASTKNAGFACFGSLTEMLDDLTRLSEAELLQLVALRWQGLARLRQRLGDARIGLMPTGGYELLQPEWAHAVGELDRLNALLRPLVHEQVFRLANDQSARFGFARDQYTHLIHNPYEASIDTGLMMHHLMQLAAVQGIRMLSGVDVTGVYEDGWVETKQGVALEAEQVCVTNNAFARELLPELEVVPGRGIVLITKPIEDLPFEGIFHMDAGYFYFRNVGKRVLLGGGRNLDPDTEATTSFTLNPRIQAALRDRLDRVILPGSPYEIEMEWAGIMAFGSVKKPIVRRIGPRLSCAVRCGGMGVAIGSMVGTLAAQQMLSPDPVPQPSLLP